MSARHEAMKGSEMNDLFLLEPEYRYHAERTRRALKPARNRRWRRRLEADQKAATREQNWIS